jgi:Glucodextranase, domain B
MLVLGLILAYVVNASCAVEILAGLASSLFTLSVTPTSVSVSPNPSQGDCGSAQHVIVTLTEGLGGVSRGTIALEIEGAVADVGLRTCAIQTSTTSSQTSESPTISWKGHVQVADGETARYDLIFLPQAKAQPGTYPISITASETSESNYIDKHEYTVNLTILPPIAPTLSITSPGDGSSTALTTVTVTGTSTDDVAVESLAYRLNSGAEHDLGLVAPITAWTFDVPGLTPGGNVIEVLARDGAGLETTASVTVTYGSVMPQLACGQVFEATLAVGKSAAYEMPIPAADFVYGLHVEGVDLDGGYEVISSSGAHWGGPIRPGEISQQLDNRLPTDLYSVTVSADNAGGTYRLILVCERPLALNTNVTVTQLSGLLQLYRFDGLSEPIHLGLHRAQVVNPIAVNVWHPSGSIYLDPVGNPAGGYSASEFVQGNLVVGAPYTVIWESLVFSPGDLDEYTFAISTVADPVELTLNASNSATANGAVQHLGHLQFFTFQGAQNDEYTVTLDHPGGSPLAAEITVSIRDASLPFYDQSGLLATGATTRDPTERSLTLGPLVLPLTGEYVIRVGANADVGYDASLAETMGAFTLLLQRQ